MATANGSFACPVLLPGTADRAAVRRGGGRGFGGAGAFSAAAGESEAGGCVSTAAGGSVGVAAGWVELSTIGWEASRVYKRSEFDGANG